jgi:mRNA-degrading endonuclease toxin of MazEF toxin-antitoxin module
MNVNAKRGEIYLVSFDPKQGHEQQGTRPMLVVSPDRFNALTGVPLVVPITTGGTFARNQGFTVSLTGAGTGTTGVIRCDQPQSIDLAARQARRIESVPDAIVDDALARLSTLFS